MEAIYLSANSFKVMGNRVSEFNAGRRIKANCGLDGTKYSSVYSSSYSAPYTTVVIDESDLTASLTSVWYSVIQTGSIGSLPDHLHSSSEGDGGQLDGSSLGLSFLSFADTPSTYSGTIGQYLRSTASGVEFANIQTPPSTFLDLTDTPSTYSGTDGQYLVSTGSGTEFANIQTPPSTFLDLTDTPVSYSGTENQYIRSTGSGVEFVENTFLELTDTPSSYSAGKYLVSTPSGIELDTLSYISTDIRADVLVREWIIVSGTIDETISWDGDADDTVVFEAINANLPTGSNIKLQFNNDTGNNYGRGLISQDGSVFEGNTADSQPNIYLTNSASDPVTVKATMFLKNTGSKRVVLAEQATQRTDNPDKFWIITLGHFWNNTADKVTAIRLWSDNSDVTGTFRLYKKANIDLPVVYGNTLGSAVGIQTIKLEWATTSGINVLPGTVHINNGVYDNYYIVDSYFEKNFTGLSNNTFYYIYVKPPTSGYAITDVEYSTTEPTRNLNKRGRYHSANTTWRCVGAFQTNSSGDIIDFTYNGNLFVGVLKTSGAGWITASDTWTTVDASGSVAFGNTFAAMYMVYDYVDYSSWPWVRAKGSTDYSYLPYGQLQNDQGTSLIMVPVNEDEEFETRWASSNSSRLYFMSYGFIIPDDIYTGAGCVSVDNSQFVPYSFGADTISGTGDIYCNEIHTTIPTFEKGKQTLQIEWNDDSSINILPGVVHIKNSTYGMYELNETVTISGASATNDWNYIYVTASGATSHVLSVDNFYFEEAYPTKDDTNLGWYYGADRSIGYIHTSSSDEVEMFTMEARDFMFSDKSFTRYNSTWGTGDGQSKTVTLFGDPDLAVPLMHYIMVDLHNGSTSDGAWISVKNTDSSASTGIPLFILENWSAAGRNTGHAWVSANSSKQITMMANATPTGDWTLRVDSIGYKWHKYFYTGA
jgi:hypothetical protein